MPTPIKPTRVLEMSGAFDKNPKRAAERGEEWKPAAGLGDPPLEFQNESSPTAQQHLALWHELMSQTVGGLLTSADRWMMELLVKDFRKVRNNTANSAEKRLVKDLLQDIGLTPVGRARNGKNIPKPYERGSDDWDEFAPTRRSAGSK